MLCVIMVIVAIHYGYAETHYAECHYGECHYAECHYAECRAALKYLNKQLSLYFYPPNNKAYCVMFICL
jgi:hypothetical protein